MMLDHPIASFRLLPAAFGFWSDSGLLLCLSAPTQLQVAPQRRWPLPSFWLERKVPELPCQYPKAPPPSFDRDRGFAAWMCSVTFLAI